MESTQLLSMLAFVDYKSQRLYTKEEELNGLPKYTVMDYITELPNHVKLLKEKTALWMFVPIGENGEILEKPTRKEVDDLEENEQFENEKYLYEIASSKCLFIIENYELWNDAVLINNKQFKISKKSGNVFFEDKVFETVNDLANEPDLKLQLSEIGYYKFRNRIEE